MATIVAALVYWFSESSGTLAVGAELLSQAIGVFWILGIGFTIASSVGMFALVRGEPRTIPIVVIASESILFLLFIMGIALS